MASLASAMPSPRNPVPRTYCPPIATRRPASSTTRPAVNGPNSGRVVLSTSTVSGVSRAGIWRSMSGTANTPARGSKPDHRDVEFEAAAGILPLGPAEIEGAGLRDLGDGHRRFQPGARKLPGSRLENVFARAHQEIEAHVVIDQQAALRHRHEKAELDENQEDRDEDAAGGKRGAPLLVNQYPPGEVERHRAKSQPRGGCGRRSTGAAWAGRPTGRI